MMVLPTVHTAAQHVPSSGENVQSTDQAIVAWHMHLSERELLLSMPTCDGARSYWNYSDVIICAKRSQWRPPHLCGLLKYLRHSADS